MLQGLDSLFPGFLKPLAHCALCYSKCCCDVFLFPSLFMQFPRLHPSLFAPIFPGYRFLLHSSFYRIAQFRTLVLSAEIYNNISSNIYIADRQHAWFSENTTFYATSDGGQNWAKVGQIPSAIGEMS